ncbi:hypothetical protein [Aureimonas ureilytica]|uniref:hypothetical protein n=1 Tax=Aureimonas ureilytica TaxID=401562 RepID=UPI0007343313|nr:hypothetical protein [Aureimonas ureilytica]
MRALTIGLLAACLLASPVTARTLTMPTKADMQLLRSYLSATPPDFDALASRSDVASAATEFEKPDAVAREAERLRATVKTTIAVDARSGSVYVTTTDDAGTLIAPDRSSWPVEVLALAVEWDTRLSQKTGATSVGSRKLDGAPDIVDLATIDQRVIFDHSGSEVAIDHDRGLLVYISPKPSLRGVVRPGQVLFRGTIPATGGTAKGTAFVFRKGCRPAGYSVTGAFSQNADRPTLLLTGHAPRRAKSGCGILAHDHGGPNSRLEFKFLVSP